MSDGGLSGEVGRIALLDNPIRAALYRELVQRDDWLGRDEAAEVAGVPRSVAAFHLDKLTEAGLVVARYTRTTGRSGPGAGRPSKLYRRSSRETAVSIPERRYSLVGQILASAVEESRTTGEPVDRVVARAAAAAGKELVGATRATRRRDPLKRVADLLAEIGYEPRIEKGEIVLRNCPFHELAREHVDLVCGMNLDLIGGIVDGLSDGKLTPRLDPEPGMCCVRISRRD